MPVSKIGTNALSSGLDVSSTNISYTGTLTGGTGVVNIGSGQVYKDSSGNVGIGTSSPAYKLDVNGGINSQTGFVYLGNANVYANYRSGNNDVIYSGASGFFYYQNITSTYHAWYTGNSERARIDSSGNLLLNTTTIADSNGAQFVNAYTFPKTGAEFRSSSTSSHYAVTFRNPNGFVGGILTSGTSTSYNTSSDYRLKDNVQPMVGALAKVAALKPVTYEWKVDGSAGQGFIAHELQEVCPDAVTGEKDAVDADGNPQYQGIDTSFLVATLTAAIQELKAELDSVKAELAVLKGV